MPSVDGYTFLINNNDATDFGAGAGGPVFNQENVYINSFVNLITGNTTAAANFATTLGGATTLTAALTAVYNSMVPTVDQTEAGRTFFLSEASYYTARAAQVDLTSIVGQAAVGAAALANILVNNNVPGLGQEINQFLGAVANGSAAVPQSENFTPIATAIGTGETGGGGTTPPPAPTPTMALTVSGDTVHLNSTTAASTVSLSGADLTAFPSATFGTVAELVSAGVTSVTDSGGNFTLNASGNNNSTTFNFGTGVVSGSDPASSAGITYSGVTTYITSANHDTVTLSAAAQNVTASNDDNTINLGSLAYTGTLNLNAGSGGTDTINATVGGNLAGGTISGTGGNAHIALMLSAAGTETLSTAEYNMINSTTAGSITFTGGTFGTDHITFSNAGTVSAIANVGNYNLSTAGDTITLTNVADSVIGAASGSDTVNLAALTYTGTVAFGATGSDAIDVTAGGDISGGTISTGGATVALVLSGAGTETISSPEFNLFNATGITGSGGIETLILNLASSTTLVDANFGASTISGIQGLEFNSTGASNFSLTTGANFASDFLTLNLTASTTTGTLGLALDAYATAATISATSTTGDQAINVGSASGTAADSVTAHSTSGTIDITVGNGGDTVSATATTLGGVIHVTAGAGIDSITASSPDAVTITSTSTTGDALLSGTSTGGAALNISANGAATTGTYNITANAASGTDTINVSQGTGTEVYNITLGSHSSQATIVTSEIGTSAVPNTIVTGAQAGDMLRIIDAMASTFSSLGAEGSVNIGINAAHTSFPGPGNVQTFTNGGNTYLVEDVASNTPLPTSTVVELVGIHTIGSVNAGTITLAS